MSAGMHLTGVHTGVRKGVALLHGQGVHVGSKSYGSGVVASLDHAHKARGANAMVDLDAPGCQQIGDRLRRPHFLETQLGVSMQIPPDACEGWMLAQNAVKDFHG